MYIFEKRQSLHGNSSPPLLQMLGSEGKNVGTAEEYISKEDIATALSKTDTETENFWHLGYQELLKLAMIHGALLVFFQDKNQGRP